MAETMRESVKRLRHIQHAVDDMDGEGVNVCTDDCPACAVEDQLEGLRKFSKELRCDSDEYADELDAILGELGGKI